MPLVALVSYSGILGGAERVLVDFARALEGERVLACPPGDLADAASAAGLRVLPLRRRPLEARGSALRVARAGLELTAHARETRRLVRDLDPDLVIVSGMRSAVALLLGRSPEAPVLFDHHDFLPPGVAGALVRRASARAQLTVVPSSAVAVDLGLDAEVVSPGVDVASFDATRAPAQPPELLLLGALVPWKRPDLALEILARARRELPELRLVIAGAPLDGAGEGLLRSLRAQASSLGVAEAVSFAGQLADVRDALARAACLLHCAPTEPFGVALVEALASGRPVIAPDAGGPAEILDPTCAVLYPAGDVAQGAAAAVKVLGDPALARRMGVAGRQRAARIFERSDSARRFAALASGLMGRRGDSSPEISVLAVTRNSADVLPGLLDSVRRHMPGAQTVLVDCASSDSSVQLGHAHEAAVVALEQNAGFGVACNRGLEEVSAPVTALLNPDVELLDDSLLRAAEEALRTGRLIAPMVLNPDGTRQDTAHPLPISAASLAGAVLPQRLAWIAPWRSRGPRRIGWAVGCAIVAPTELLRSLGPFDERIFMYGEDLDLALRAREHGIETWFWPSARVVHHGAHTAVREFGGEPLDRVARTRHEVVHRRLGARAAATDDAILALTYLSRIVAKAALGRDHERERRQLSALRGVHSSR
jgi:glycosyltransferase involved in cell wall biosynthesis/GT2 family glycosyltransferase